MKQLLHDQSSMKAITSKNKQSRQQKNTMNIQCRICLSEEYQANNKFINPCACKGSIKYAHINCLSAWILKLQNSIDYRKNKAIVCQLCKYKIGYDKSQSFSCCSKEEYLHNIQEAKALFITLVLILSILFITLIAQAYFLQDRVQSLTEGRSFFQMVVIALCLALSLGLEITLASILVSSYFIKKQIKVTSIQQSKISSSQFNQTFDSIKSQTFYSFSFV